jgi:hypothetical protein
VFNLNKCLVKTVVENTFQKITSYNCLFKSMVEVEVEVQVEVEDAC